MKIEMTRFGKPFEPGKNRRKKRNSLLGVAAFLVIVLILVAIATIVIEVAIRTYVVAGQEETWAASVASY